MAGAAAEQTSSEGGGLVRSAGIIGLGNIASRLLGLLRVTIIVHLFGATGFVSAFEAAARVPTMLYDFLISGMLTAALVPVLSEYATKEKRDELWRLASVLLTAVTLLMGVLVLILELFAPSVAWVMAGGFEPELLDVTARLIRLILPAAIFFGLSGVVTGVLYSLKRFSYPAFGAAVYNLGIIIAAPLLAGRWDIYSLAVGVLAGSALQLAIQLPGLRGTRLRPCFDFSHPALRRILKLYLPIAAGLVITQFQIIIDRRLASGTGEQSIAWMANATQLIQFPHGLVSVAISLAVLPSLSRQSLIGDWSAYRKTLATGLRMVIVLIVPAVVGLFILGRPLIELIFEHGRFTPYDTQWVSLALYGYLIGLLFASVDWPLNYAFYARQDTLTPALVGLASVFVYLATALLLIKPLGFIGLVLADSAKQASHALMMWHLLRRRVGPLHGGLLHTLLKALSASLLMGGAVWLVWHWQAGVLGPDVGVAGRILAVFLPSGVGGVVYLFLAMRFGIGELPALWNIVRKRIRGEPPTGPNALDT